MSTASVGSKPALLRLSDLVDPESFSSTIGLPTYSGRLERLTFIFF